MRFLSILVLAGLFTSMSAQRSITLEDVGLKGTFRAHQASDFTPMSDGLHVAAYQNKVIVKMRLSDGAVMDTLFSPSQAGIKDTFDFDSFILSDDGNLILLATGSTRIYRHTFVANYYLYNRLNKSLEPLSKGGMQQSPVFSPDEKHIAFIRNNNIVVYNINEKYEWQITTDGEPRKIINGAPDWVYEEEFTLVQAMQWSPDGSKLAFLRFDETLVPEYEMPIYGNETYPSLYRFKYPKAGEKNSVVTLHVFDFDSKQTTTMQTSSGEDEYLPRFYWSLNSNLLSAIRLNRHQNQLDILFCSPDGTSRKVYTEKDTAAYIPEVNDSYFTFINERNQFLIQSEKNGYNHVYLFNPNGSLVRQVTKGNWEVSEVLGVDPKMQMVYFSASTIKPYQTEIYSIRFDGTRMQRLTPNNGTNDAQFFPGCKYFLHTYSTSITPPRIVLRDNRGRELRALEENKALCDTLKTINYPAKEFSDITLPNGSNVYSWIIKPSNFDPSKKYPVLMYVYGGPGSQTVIDEWSTDWFYALADKGYIIASFDNRGTGKRGTAFRECTYKKLGILESDDQISAAHYLAGLPFIDSTRIGIYGWSYGGYMTAMSLFRGNGIFKAAASVAPVSDWRFYDSAYTERYMSLPQDNKSGYKNSSVLQYAEKAKGKYLLIHGTADDNVHFQNSMDLAAALVNHNFPFEMQVYPDKNHGIYGGYARLHVYLRLQEFFLRNL